MQWTYAHVCASWIPPSSLPLASKARTKWPRSMPAERHQCNLPLQVQDQDSSGHRSKSPALANDPWTSGISPLPPQRRLFPLALTPTETLQHPQILFGRPAYGLERVESAPAPKQVSLSFPPCDPSRSDHGMRRPRWLGCLKRKTKRCILRRNAKMLKWMTIKVYWFEKRSYHSK